MIGAVHPEQRTLEQERGVFVLEVLDHRHEILGVVGKGGAVAVPLEQVLGPHA